MHETSQDLVKALVSRLGPDPVCNFCLSEILALDLDQDVGRSTNELAGTKGFERQISDCVICRKSDKTIRFTAR